MLNVLSLQQAIELSKKIAMRDPSTQILPLSSLSGRVSATDIFCPQDLPGFCRSTMDGYAVIAADTFGANESSPSELTVIGEICMGEEAQMTVRHGNCVKIPTGGMLPKGADAVIPVEYTDTDFETCLINTAVSPGQYVTKKDDDAKQNELLIKAGTRFTPSVIGVLAAAGIIQAEVFVPPKVAVLSTGNEVVPVSDDPPSGKVRDVNGPLLCALMARYGCESKYLGIIPDCEEALCFQLSEAAKTYDFVLLSGGSSAGEKDLTAKVIAKLGKVYAHGVAMKPGKPTVVGTIAGTPVFGLPGHPAACYFVTETIVKACVETLTGAPLPCRTTQAVITDNISSNHGREEFICVRLHNGAAEPVYGKSGIVSQLSRADGYIRVSRDAEGIKKGETVTVYYI